MGLRAQKQKYHQAVVARLKMGLLNDEQAARFKLMFSRCKGAKDFDEVMTALRGFCAGIQKDTDRYARLVQDDPLGLEED